MKVLYIDTTTADLVVAVIEQNKITDVSQRAMGVKHSETLCNKVAEALAEAGVGFDCFDAYACALGPGSFTGIRIGISTIKGYCTAIERPYIEVNSLEAIARSAFCGKIGRAVIDAGNGYYYFDGNVTLPYVIPYDDVTAVNAGSASGACDYLDGAVEIICQKYADNDFSKTLSPIYIRKSQAEITRENLLKNK